MAEDYTRKEQEQRRTDMDLVLLDVSHKKRSQQRPKAEPAGRICLKRKRPEEGPESVPANGEIEEEYNRETAELPWQWQEFCVLLP